MKQVTIPLTKIGFFNPGRFTDAEIEQSFITRIPFFEFLFKKIIAEKADSIPQHYLIIGQRGMGKTSLLVRIAAELRKSPYRDSFIPLSFPEEQYNVDKLSKFWLNCLDALADALDKENNTTELSALDAEINILSKNNNAEASFIYEKFKGWTAKINRRPILLVDNLNLIFAKISKEEQHQLRAILMSKNAPILVGASATSIEETIDYGAPFYDAFQISYLKKLSFQESLDVLLNLAKITGNNNFEKNVHKHKGRLEALYQLTGGTPRTLAILFPLIQDGFSESIQTDLDALLDVITPLYKAKFEELSPQLQVVLDAVALHWDPMNLEQLRKVTHLENAQLSPQLKRLIDIGWLQKLDAYKAKGGAYELTERFFNVWYLMRRSSRRQKRELYCLTKFLESFYGNDLQEIAKIRILSKCESANHITLDLALADAVNDKDVAGNLRKRSYERLLDMSIDNEDILNNFTIPDEFVKIKIIELVNEAKEMLSKNKYNDAIIICDKIAKLSGESKLGFVVQGCVNAAQQKYLDAEQAFKKSLELENDDDVWRILGDLYMDNLKNLSEAKNAYINATEINDKNVDAWMRLGSIYFNNDWVKTKIAYKKVIEIDNNNYKAWVGLGGAYYFLKKFEKSSNALREAIKINDSNPELLSILGDFQIFLKNYKEAETLLKRLIEIEPNNSLALDSLGNLYRDYLHKYLEAEGAYKNSIQADSNNADAKNNLVILWRDKMKKIKEAKDLFTSIVIDNEILDRHYLNEAIFAFYENNEGTANDFIEKALDVIEENLPENTQDDWYRAAAVIIKLGYGNNLLQVFANTGHNIILRPFYVAIEALNLKGEELFLNSIAAEIREPAKKILELMKSYME